MLEMTKYNKNQRKKLFIHPEFQKSFLIYTAGISLSSLLIVFLASSYFFHVYTQRGQAVGLPEGHIYFQLIKEQQSSMIGILFFTFLIITTGTTYYGLFMSNKIAGPILRLKSYFKGLSEGSELKPLKFREGDYFSDIANDINAYLFKDKNKPE